LKIEKGEFMKRILYLICTFIIFILIGCESGPETKEGNAANEQSINNLKIIQDQNYKKETTTQENIILYTYINLSFSVTIISQIEINVIQNIEKAKIGQTNKDEIENLYGKPTKIVIIKYENYYYLNYYYGRIIFVFGIYWDKLIDKRMQNDENNQETIFNIGFKTDYVAKDIKIKSIKGERIGDYIKFVMLTESEIERGYFFFNPPNGDKIFHRQRSGIKKGINIESFDVDISKLLKVNEITMSFCTDKEGNSPTTNNFIYLNYSDITRIIKSKKIKNAYPEIQKVKKELNNDFKKPDIINQNDYELAIENTEKRINYIYNNKNFTDDYVSKIEMKVIQELDDLKCGKTTIKEIEKLYGKPTKILIVKMGNEYFLTYFYGEIQLFFAVNWDILVEKRFFIGFGLTESKYAYKGKVKIGSSLDDIINFLGSPKKIVNGKPNNYEDDVLYKNIDGYDGWDYICYKSKGIRLFFQENKVNEMMLFF
jgi:hypothetical protein